MKILVAAAVVGILGGIVLALANEVGKFCEEVNPHNVYDQEEEEYELETETKE